MTIETTDSEKEAFIVGVQEGLTRHTWMKDGVYYVGNGTYTLKQAFEMLRKDYPQLSHHINKF